MRPSATGAAPTAVDGVPLQPADGAPTTTEPTIPAGRHTQELNMQAQQQEALVRAWVKKWKQDHPDGGSDDEEPEAFAATGTGKKVPYVDWFSFNVGVGFIILANSVTIGLETAAKSTGEESGIYFLIELIFCTFFLIELVLRLYFHRWRFFVHTGGAESFKELVILIQFQYANIFDFLIVFLTAIDTYILTAVGMGGTVKISALLRFSRVLRTVRLIRLFTMFKELWLVVCGLFHAIKGMFWICTMLVLLVEIAAIVTTRSIGHNDVLYDPYFASSGGWDHEVYFKTTWRSMLTLFQILTFDSWSEEIVRHVGQQQPGMLAFFVAFIVILSFGLLNLVAGLVVEATFRLALKDRTRMLKLQEKKRRTVFSQLRLIFKEADTDHSGKLSQEEVREVIAKPEIYQKLKTINFPVEEPERMFTLLDYADTGELTISEFVTGCIRVRGMAKSRDLLNAQVAINELGKYLDIFDVEMEKLHGKLRVLDKTVRSLVHQGEHLFLQRREYHQRHPEKVKEYTVPRLPTKDLGGTPWSDGWQGSSQEHALLNVPATSTSGQALAITNAQSEQAPTPAIGAPQPASMPAIGGDHGPARHPALMDQGRVSNSKEQPDSPSVNKLVLLAQQFEDAVANVPGSVP